MKYIFCTALRLCGRCFSKISTRGVHSRGQFAAPVTSLTSQNCSFQRPSKFTNSSQPLYSIPLPSAFSKHGHITWKYSQSSTVRRFASQSSNTENAGKVQMPLWGRLLIVAGIGGAAYYMLRSAEHEKDLVSEEVRHQEFEKISLGGDWTLIDHHGKKRSSTDFRGQWIVMYMGFTHCPDICPEEMEKLGQIVLNFDKDSKLPNLQPVFITLDPERDTPAAIKSYLKDFKSPRIVGFTGTEDEIREVAKKYRAYFAKGPKDEDNDYIVDHTIVIYLINPKGDFVNYYGRSLTADQVTKSITKHIHNYEELEKCHQ